MNASKPLSDTSRVPWNLSNHVVLLEIDGVPGWLLPAHIDVLHGSVVVRWEAVAEEALDVGRYRIWFGEEWFDFLAEPTHVTKGGWYEITATLQRT